MSGTDFDIICVGSGAAGLAGALRAVESGARTLVLEKAAAFGGTTAWSYGGIWAGANHVQRSLGIDDSLEEAGRYLRFLAGGFHDEARLERFLHATPGVLEYLDERGVTLQEVEGVPELYYPDAPGSTARGRCLDAVPIARAELGEWADLIEPIHCFPPGVSWADMVAWGGPANRFRWDPEVLAQRAERFAAGQALIARLVLACASRGVDLRHSTPAVELLFDGGRVTGVVADAGGERVAFTARRGVLLATGGYLGNKALVRALEDFGEVGNHMPPAVTGDGLVMAAEHGAMISKIPLHLARTLGYMVPSDNAGEPARFDTAGVTQLPYPHCIVVNGHGRRFGDESFFQNLVPRLHEFDMATHSLANFPCFMVFDQQFVDRYGFAGLEPGRMPDWVPRGDTTRELASRLGVDAATFARTVDDFNDAARHGKQDEFGRGASTWARGSTGDSAAGAHTNPNIGPLDVPPYYGVELVPSGAGAGGLTADVDGRVLHVRGGPIPGLYGAGVVCCVNEYGAGYQAGFSISSGMTFACLAVDVALA